MFYMSDDLLRHGIYVEKMLLKFKYDIVKNLNNKLKDNNLSFAESKKINDDIIKKENEIFGSKQLIYDCNGIRTHNHLVRKRTLNHLAILVK